MSKVKDIRRQENHNEWIGLYSQRYPSLSFTINHMYAQIYIYIYIYISICIDILLLIIICIDE